MIRLALSLPCRLNRLYMGRGRGIMLSPDARKLTKKLLAEIEHQLGGRPEPMIGRVHATLEIIPRDKRIPDVDAYCKHLLDVMTKARVWTDDKQVTRLTIDVLEPKFPGCVIFEAWEV